MNPSGRKLMLILATFTLGAIAAPMAFAGCASPFNKAHASPQAWHGADGAAPRLLLASEQGPTMVGMWHVLFIAEGNGPGLPPDGAQVDNAFSTWHSDGTELMLSARPPATGDVCLGVWEETGERHYKLNHYAIAFDPSVDPNTPQGFANIREDVTLSRDGKTFTGCFSISQYDASGNLLVEIKGDLVGTRVTVSTTEADLLGS